jgi:hypothetical protein
MIALKEEKFVLGPIQKTWIRNLRTYPQYQHSRSLGYVFPTKTCHACALGFLLFTYRKETGIGNTNGEIKDLSEKENFTLAATYSLPHSYLKFGLASDLGAPFPQYSSQAISISQMNDELMTFPEIADAIEKNPHYWFNKSF